MTDANADENVIQIDADKSVSYISIYFQFLSLITLISGHVEHL